MQKYQSSITTTTGAVVRKVPVSVLTEDGAIAEIFMDRAGTIKAANPLQTDSRGIFFFYAVNGRYSLRTSVDGVTITDDDAVLMNDPEELATAGPIAEAVAAAQLAAKQAQDAVDDSGIPDLVSQAQNAVLDASTALTEARSAAQSADSAKTQASNAQTAAEAAQSSSTAAQNAAESAANRSEAARDIAQSYAQSINPDALRDRTNHTGTQAIASINGLQGELDATRQAIAMAATFTAVPSTFQAWVIVVTQPHLRVMTWNGTRYVRAPWHQPGTLRHVYRDLRAGELEVRTDVTLQAADFPDLAEYLGVTGATFVLDEARGGFLRSLSNGRSGVDVGRVVGSEQGFGMPAVTGSVTFHGGAITGPNASVVQSASGAFSATGALSSYHRADGEAGSTSYLGLSFSTAATIPNAADLRPLNRAYRIAVTY